MKKLVIFLLLSCVLPFNFLYNIVYEPKEPQTFIEYAPPGTIVYWAGSTAPTGWLMADGAAYSRTIVYNRLFAVTGTMYGVGDGSTTFNVPDCRQRFVIGKSVSGTGAVLGETGGTIDHLHTVDPPSTASGAPSATSNVTNTLATDPRATAAHTHTTDIAVFNSGVANPPYITLNMIIKY